MGKSHELVLIGIVMVVGILAGTLYVHAAGTQPRLSLSDGALKTPEERVAMENRAIDIALSDPRVGKLANVTGARIFSGFYMNFQVFWDNNVTQTGGYGMDWDQKYRAFVTIRYPDDTGYGIHVNITDGIVDEPVKALWKNDGRDFYLIP